jgi:antitoxin PrlF
MVVARSKITSQGQISVPAEIRRRLGLGPGSIIEWEEKGEDVIVKRSSRYSSEDIHHEVFSSTPSRKDLTELKEGIRRHIRKTHAGR